MNNIDSISDDSKNKIIFGIGLFFISCASFILSLLAATVNMDSHHYGVMYAAAVGIKKGLIPHKEIFLHHGYLASLIQSFSLNVLGNNIRAIGIVTGIFYSASLVISYYIFCKILPRAASFCTVLFIFLIHPYSDYPWPNYYAFTFQLLAILFFLTSKDRSANMLISGFFVGLAFLSRYSSLIAILPPFLFLLAYEYLIENKADSTVLFKKGATFCIGFLIPAGIFFAYLFACKALPDFWLQNKIMIMDPYATWYTRKLTTFLGSIILARTYSIRDLRSWLYTANFLFSGFTFLYFIFKSRFQKLENVQKIVMAISLFSLFGYFNSVHIYEIFRLQNGASIGFGVIAYCCFRAYGRLKKPLGSLILISLIPFYFILGSSALFKTTSSTYHPWDLNILSKKGAINKKIGIFEGKIMSAEYSDFYDRIYDRLSRLPNRGQGYYFVNLTYDPLLCFICDLPLAQICPYFNISFLENYPGEIRRIEQLYHDKKAIVFSRQRFKASGYKTILYEKFPSDVVFLGGELYLSVPDALATESQGLAKEFYDENGNVPIKVFKRK